MPDKEPNSIDELAALTQQEFLAVGQRFDRLDHKVDAGFKAMTALSLESCGAGTAGSVLTGVSLLGHAQTRSSCHDVVVTTPPSSPRIAVDRPHRSR